MTRENTDSTEKPGADPASVSDVGLEDGSESTTAIVTQPCELSAAEATARVTGSVTEKLRRLWRDTEVIRTVRRYKPYYEFDATLRKRYFRAEDEVYEGAIVVDGFTGVARPILHDQVETVEERVPVDAVLDRDVDERTAYNRANRNRLRVQQQEDGEIDLAERASLVYKPLWLLELDSGDVRVVDATNGQVFSDRLL